MQAMRTLPSPSRRATDRYLLPSPRSAALASNSIAAPPPRRRRRAALQSFAEHPLDGAVRRPDAATRQHGGGGNALEQPTVPAHAARREVDRHRCDAAGEAVRRTDQTGCAGATGDLRQSRPYLPWQRTRRPQAHTVERDHAEATGGQDELGALERGLR